jgi:hypothetical protein
LGKDKGFGVRSSQFKVRQFLGAGLLSNCVGFGVSGGVLSSKFLVLGLELGAYKAYGACNTTARDKECGGELAV